MKHETDKETKENNGSGMVKIAATALGGIAVGIAATIMANKETRKDATERVEDVLKKGAKVADEVKEKSSQTIESLKSAGSAGMESAKSYKETIENIGSSLLQKGKELVDEVTGQVKEIEKEAKKK